MSIYFIGIDANGGELWRTDGTPTGTYMVKDINPGSGSGVYTGGQVVFLPMQTDCYILGQVMALMVLNFGVLMVLKVVPI